MNWPSVRIDRVAEVNPRLPKDVDETQIVSFIGMASVSEDGKLLSEEDRILADTKKGFTYFTREDVLLAKITPCFENGKSLHAGQISHEIGYGSTEFHVLRANPKELDSKYLFYLIWSDNFRFYGQHSMSGAAGQKRVSTDFINGFQIPLPPLPEQKRIAAILEKADNLRRKRQQAIQLADEFLRAAFLDMFGDPVTNPKSWDIFPLGDLVENLDGKRVPVKAADRAQMAGSYPYYGASGVIDYVDDFVFEGRNLLIGEDGANLLARSTPIAFIADGRYWVNNHAHVLAQKDGLSLEYLRFSINLRDLAPYISGSAQPKLNQTSLNRIPVQVPSRDVLDRFDKMVMHHSRLTIKMRSALGEPIFDSLSQKAFSVGL